MSQSWKFDGTRVYFVGQDKSPVLASAMEIFSSAFNGKSTAGGMPIIGNPIEDIPELVFSRYPVETAVKITGRTPRPLSLLLGVLGDGNFVEMNESVDQVVINSKWFPIDIESTRDAKEWLEAKGIKIGEELTLSQLILLRATSTKPFVTIDETRTSNEDLASLHEDKNEGIHNLDAILYPYQRIGVSFLQAIAAQGIGCILADEMGLGKTLQIISLAQSETDNGRKPSLIVTPATLLENWRREIQQFAPSLKYLVHSGPERAGVSSGLSGYDLIVTSYDTVIRDEPMLSEIKWNMVVIDEAQSIKNPNAQRTQAVKRIQRRVSIAVTGTPVENSLGDLWSISDFVLPELLGSVNQFRNNYADDIDDASRLGLIVAPIILRRRVTEVANDLPEKIEIPQPIRMTERIAGLYESVRNRVIDEYGKSSGIVSTLKLRTLCAHPSIEEKWFDDPSCEMPKYQRLLELLEEIFGMSEKSIVFTSYQKMNDIFMSDIACRWPNGFFNFIDGRVAVSNRQSIIDSFYQHKGYGSLFLTPKSAGTGLNITAANHVIHYNPEWNPALTAQSTSRAYRRKQTRPVTAHHMYFVNTVEDVMVNRAEFKRRIAGGAVTGHEGDVDPSIIIRALEISPTIGIEWS